MRQDALVLTAVAVPRRARQIRYGVWALADAQTNEEAA